MADTTAKRSIAKEVESKAVEKKCLICGNAATGNRGLCVADYLRFYRAMMDLHKKERPAFEEEQIHEGRILAAGQLRKFKRPNPFVSRDKKDAT